MESTVIRIIRIVLVVLAVVGIIWLVVWLFGPKDNNDEPATTTPTTSTTEQASVVRYVQDGEIVAPENHYRVEITISPLSRKVDVYKGYDTGPEKSQSYNNNQASYDAFYAGLVSSGFFSQKENKNNYDRKGYCPLGIRYDYQAGEDIAAPSYNTWSASCSGRAGTFAGNKSQVQTLFKDQIPDYSTVVKGVNL